LRVEPKDRKIGLSRKNLYGGPEEGTETPSEESPEGGAKAARELRGGTGSGTGQLFTMPEGAPESK
jgi:hypothetical protein